MKRKFKDQMTLLQSNIKKNDLKKNQVDFRLQYV